MAPVRGHLQYHLLRCARSTAGNRRLAPWYPWTPRGDRILGDARSPSSNRPARDNKVTGWIGGRPGQVLAGSRPGAAV